MYIYNIYMYNAMFFLHCMLNISRYEKVFKFYFIVVKEFCYGKKC